MKKSIALTILILISALAGLTQTPCERYVAPAGGFSMCPPPGWTLKDREGQQYKMMFGPPSEVFNANLNFKEEVTAIALKEYVDATVDNILKNYASVGATSTKLVSRTEFVTDSMERGEKTNYLTDFKGMQINTAQYIFNAGAKKLLATFTALESDKAANEKLFDAAIKTLQIDR